MVSKMFNKGTSGPIRGEDQKKNAHIHSVKQRTIQKLIDQQEQAKKRKWKSGQQNPKKGLLMQQLKKDLAKSNGNFTGAMSGVRTGMISVKQEKNLSLERERRKSYPPVSDVKVKVEAPSVSDMQVKVEAVSKSEYPSTSAQQLSRRHSADSASASASTSSAAQRKVLYIDTTELQHYPERENPRKSSWKLRKVDNKPGFEGRYRNRHDWQDRRQKDFEAYKNGTFDANRSYAYDSDE